MKEKYYQLAFVIIMMVLPVALCLAKAAADVLRNRKTQSDDQAGAGGHFIAGWHLSGKL